LEIRQRLNDLTALLLANKLSPCGTRIADAISVGVKKLEDLVAFLLAVEFKRGVYRVVKASPDAFADLRYRSQIFDAARSVEANIAEGWKRFSPADRARFFRIALGSLEEAKVRLRDGVDSGYFTAADCAEVLVLGNRCGAALTAFWKTLRGFADNPDHRA
jgi:four helix bundle protein